MMRSVLFQLAGILLSTAVLAQDFSVFEYRPAGPYRGGRVTAVSGVVAEPSAFYLGATGGGVWKTTDYGTSWENVSDTYFRSPSIGAIAVAENDANIIYVGTGSDGLRSNVIPGSGMYKSIDGGKTWSSIGLGKTGHIGAVVIHPANHNIVYVAAIGNAFKPTAERGIYKTVDGGRTWERVLFISDQSGFSDVELMPSNPDIVYATAWKAERKPWTITSGGTPEEGGIYRSVDGGQTWDKVTKGLPDKLIGKIDLAVTPADSRLVYALVEAPGKAGGLYKSNDQGQSFNLVSSHSGIRTRPFYYTNIEVDPQNPDVIYAMATGYYKSEDGGKTWKRRSSPHGDNHDMWIHPANSDLFIQSNDGGANITHNGGETWSTQFNQNTAEIYQVEVDDQYPYWLYGGQQDNSTTVSVPSMAPYGIQYPGIGYIMNTGGCETGPAVPKPGNADIVYANCKGRFSVYDKKTGTERSYDVGASNMYGHNPKDLEYRFQRVSPIHVSPHDPGVVYHCSQYVHMTRDEGKTWERISPDLTAFEDDKQVISGDPITRDITGEEFYSTIYAIRESPIQQGLIWVGANDGPIHVTRDGGQKWTNVTPKGLPPGGRVDAVEPSPHDPAKAYAAVLRYQLGDDRPYIYRTNDYGTSWTLLTNGENGIPADAPCRVVREDPTVEGLLFAGTEYGVFVSFDDGVRWVPFQQNLPITPVTDMKIHRGDLVISTMGRGFWIADNISSLGQADFFAMEEAHLFKPPHTYRYVYPSGARRSDMPRYPRPAVPIDYHLPAEVEGPVQLDITDAAGKLVASYFSDITGMARPDSVVEDMSMNTVEFIVDQSLKKSKGMHRFQWNMTRTGPWHKDASRRYKSGPRVAPGSYEIALTVNGERMTQSRELRQDPRITSLVSADDIAAQVALQTDVIALLSAARQKVEALKKEKERLEKEESADESVQAELDNIKSQLARLETKEGTYQQPMLVAQIQYLYNMITDVDQLPGKDAMDRYQTLKKAFDAIGTEGHSD